MPTPPLKYEQIQQRIGIAKAQDRNRQSTWNMLDEMLRNNFGSITLPDGEEAPRIAPNVIHSHLQEVVPLLYFADPDFYVIAENETDQAGAETNERVLNHYWRVLKVKREMRQCIANAYTYRIGVMKCGMPIAQQPDVDYPDPTEQKRFAQEENLKLLLEGEVEVQETDDRAAHVLVHQSLLEDPAAQQIMEINEGARERVVEHIEKHNAQPPMEERALDMEALPIQQPFLKSINPKHIFFEPGIEHWEESAYIMHRIGVRVADLKKSDIYNVPNDIAASGLDPEILQLLRSQTEDDIFDVDRALAEYPEFGTVWIYEIWDRNSRTLSTWIEEREKPIRNFEPWPYNDIEGYPFRVLTYSDVPGIISGPSPLEILMFPQAMLKRLYGQVGDHTDKGGAIAEIVEPNLTQESKQEIDAILADPTHKRGIKVTEKGSISWVAPAPLDPMILPLVSMIEQGVIPEDTGITPQNRMTGATATEASIVASGSNVAISDRINTTEDFQVENARMLLGVLKEHGPDEEEILVGTQVPEWLTWKKQDITPLCHIMIESPSPTDSERDRQMSLNLYHELRESPNLEGTGRMELEKDIFRTHGKKIYQRYLRNPDPEVQAAIESEHMIFAAGQYVPAKPGQNHAAHMNGHLKRHEMLQQAIAKREQMTMQTAQQTVEQAGANGQGAQIIQGIVQQDPELQRGMKEIQLLEQHFVQHQQVQQSERQGQGGRFASSLPSTENPGEPHSKTTRQIMSAQTTGQ